MVWRATLPVAHADVIDDEISRDDLMRAGARHMAAALADNDAELALVVECLGNARHDESDRRAR